MTGHIQNPANFLKSIWDWGTAGINDALPGKIRCSDIDGFVDLNGRHLFLEAKHVPEWHQDKEPLPYDEVPAAQRRAFQSLADKGGTVVIIYGRAADANPLGVEIIHKKDGIIRTTKHDFRIIPNLHTVENRRRYLGSVIEKWVNA